MRNIEDPSLFDKSVPKILFRSKLIQFIYFRYKSYHQPKSKVEKLIFSNLKKFEMLLMSKREILDLFTLNNYISPEHAAVNFGISKEYIDFIIEECKKKNIQVYFMNLSYLIYSPSFKESKNEELVRISNILLKEYLKTKNIPLIDLEDVVTNYYKANPKGSFFILNDGHPTKEAHGLFANKIAEWLEKLIL